MTVIALARDDRVAEEAAEQEFQRFAEAMELDIDTKGMDDEDRKEFEDLKRKVVRAIVKGKLVIDQQGQPIYTPLEGNPIVFAEPRGKAMLAADLKKEGHSASKTYAAMADFTGQPITVFSNMLQRDLRVCLAIAKLFLA